jgi:hypothetical protein
MRITVLVAAAVLAIWASLLLFFGAECGTWWLWRCSRQPVVSAHLPPLSDPSWDNVQDTGERIWSDQERDRQITALYVKQRQGVITEVELRREVQRVVMARRMALKEKP